MRMPRYLLAAARTKRHIAMPAATGLDSRPTDRTAKGDVVPQKSARAVWIAPFGPLGWSREAGSR